MEHERHACIGIVRQNCLALHAATFRTRRHIKRIAQRLRKEEK